eukprot:6205745-Pleurochrysis_carterae.AAC.2
MLLPGTRQSAVSSAGTTRRGVTPRSAEATACAAIRFGAVPRRKAQSLSSQAASPIHRNDRLITAVFVSLKQLSCSDMDVFDDPQPISRSSVGAVARHSALGRSAGAEPGQATTAVSPMLAILAGGCASATVDIALYPLDTLKTRMQVCRGMVYHYTNTSLENSEKPS